MKKVNLGHWCNLPGADLHPSCCLVCLVMCPGCESNVFSCWIFTHQILPNKYACLNKCAPPLNFWLYLAISQKRLNRFWSTFQHLTLKYSGVHTIDFIEIQQGWGLVFCLCAWHVYSVKHSISWARLPPHSPAATILVKFPSLQKLGEGRGRLHFLRNFWLHL